MPAQAADEYDAAQERGEINKHGGKRRGDDFKFSDGKLENLPPKDIHEARQIRDAKPHRVLTAPACSRL